MDFLGDTISGIFLMESKKIYTPKKSIKDDGFTTTLKWSYVLKSISFFLLISSYGSLIYNFFSFNEFSIKKFVVALITISISEIINYFNLKDIHKDSLNKRKENVKYRISRLLILLDNNNMLNENGIHYLLNSYRYSDTSCLKHTMKKFLPFFSSLLLVIFNSKSIAEAIINFLGISRIELSKFNINWIIQYFNHIILGEVSNVKIFNSQIMILLVIIAITIALTFIIRIALYELQMSFNSFVLTQKMHKKRIIGDLEYILSKIESIQ